MAGQASLAEATRHHLILIDEPQPSSDAASRNVSARHRQPLSNSRDGLAARRHQSEYHERAAVDDCLTVDEHCVFTVAAVNSIDVDIQRPPEPRRHTDSVQPGDSERAVANDDSRHGTSQVGLQRT